MTKSEAGRKGGNQTLRKHGVEHFQRIGARGAKTTWSRYGLKPVGTSQFAMVHRESGVIVAFLDGAPFPHSTADRQSAELAR